MRISPMTYRSILPLIAAIAIAPLAEAQGRDPFDRPTVGVPVKFASTNGGSFRPRALVVITQSGAVIAALPATSNDARSEDRVDLSSAPLLGGVFRGRLAPSDARAGERIGDVRRVGDALVVDASAWPQELQGLPVTLTTRVPGDGAISYRMGRLDYGQTAPQGGGGTVLGFAALVDGQLVIASNGANIPGLSDLLGLGD